jgi:hypothetical protein
MNESAIGCSGTCTANTDAVGANRLVHNLNRHDAAVPIQDSQIDVCREKAPD